METITRINGNGQPYTTGLPDLVYFGFINDVALAHIKENTGLDFLDIGNSMLKATPTSSQQIVALFMTYNMKTRYYNNWNWKNAICLKSDHHIGFEVNSICYDCCKENHIHTSLKPGERISC